MQRDCVGDITKMQTTHDRVLNYSESHSEASDTLLHIDHTKFFNSLNVRVCCSMLQSHLVTLMRWEKLLYLSSIPGQHLLQRCLHQIIQEY